MSSVSWRKILRAAQEFWLDLLSLACLGLCFFFIASLLSYSARDPSGNVYVRTEPENMMGYSGAFVSDFLFQWFGLGAFSVIPFFLALFFSFALRQKIRFLYGAFFLGASSLGLFQYFFLPQWQKSYPNALISWVMHLLGHKGLGIWLLGGTILCTMGVGGWIFWQRRLRGDERPDGGDPISDHDFLKPKKSTKKSPSRVQTLTQPEALLPPLTLFNAHSGKQNHVQREWVEEGVLKLQRILEDFGVRGQVLRGSPGPIVTLFEFEPAAGVKSSRIISLSDDIARAMSSLSARVAVIPGKNLIGVEISNPLRQTVYLKDLLGCDAYSQFDGQLALALGRDIGGHPVIVDLAKMPHLLVAGTTGSGKSVGINDMILSLLYRLSPEKCKFIMIDPKMLELSVYDGIPHLLSPVITDPKKAILALKWVVQEMESRYREMSQLGVRNIMGYNQRVAESKRDHSPLAREVHLGFDDQDRPMIERQILKLEPFPYIVVVVDEMADLMLLAGKEIEVLVQRLAQMARAAGIHIIMATQRPSVDVITGTIKANFPTRISFQVTSKIDSRTILGEQGAEHLLGHGDMLYMAPGGRITRVHGPFVSDQEIEKIVGFLTQQGAPQYVDMVVREEEESLETSFDEGKDTLYQQAVAIIQRDRKVSTSYIQRQLKIGYNRSANIIEQMEKEGLISAPNHSGKREVLC